MLPSLKQAFQSNLKKHLAYNAKTQDDIYKGLSPN